MYKTNITDSSDELNQLANLLSDSYSLEVLKMLVKARKKNIYNSSFYNLVTYPQYFIDELRIDSKKYTLVDVGSYDGDTVNSFISESKLNYHQIYCFEPDPLNLEQLKVFVNKSDINHVTIIDKGVFDKSGVVHFSNNNFSASKIDNLSSYTVEVITLDDYFGDSIITNPLLKMDIEGAELNALQGAYGFINKHKPIMAICIYHEPDHLFSIPFYIKEHHSFYDLIIRHHSNDWTETVLYCMPKNLKSN